MVKFSVQFFLSLLIKNVILFTGWLCDITGTYHLSFYLAGLFIALSGLLLIILPATKRYKKFQMLQRQASSDCSIKDGYQLNNDIENNTTTATTTTTKEPKFHNILTSCITGKVDNCVKNEGNRV